MQKQQRTTMNKDKQNLIIQDILARITKYQLLSQDDNYFNWIEELRQHIVDFKEGNIISDTCQKCGCTEFLCGHNKEK